MTTHLTINVCGSAHTGKSTVASLIEKCLTEHGFSVKINDTNGVDEPHVEVSPTTQLSRLESLKNKNAGILIETQLTLKSF